MKVYIKKIRAHFSNSLEQFDSYDLKLYSKMINKIQSKAFSLTTKKTFIKS